MKYYAHTAVDPDGNPSNDEALWQPLAVHLRNVNKGELVAKRITPQGVRPSGALPQKTNYDFNPRLPLSKGDNFKIQLKIYLTRKSVHESVMPIDCYL
jgi:hypothetical protein